MRISSRCVPVIAACALLICGCDAARQPPPDATDELVALLTAQADRWDQAYVRRGGAWQIVSVQISPIPADTPGAGSVSR
ncbi:MAG: hypothetical protein ACREVI_12745 [Steroidobacteraceae bacterium]